MNDDVSIRHLALEMVLKYESTMQGAPPIESITAFITSAEQIEEYLRNG